MKVQSNLLTIVLILFAFASCQNSENDKDEDQNSNVQTAQPDSFDRETELESIKQVIQGETESFFNRDYENWESYWIKKEYSMRAGNGPDSTYAMYGWNNISEYIENYDEDLYKNNEGSKYSSPKRENFEIKFNSNSSAYAKWKQYNLVTNQDMYYLSEESRLLEKEENGWKIVNVLSFWDTTKPVDSLAVLNSFKQ